MKLTWVLSQEERERRFTKLKKKSRKHFIFIFCLFWSLISIIFTITPTTKGSFVNRGNINVCDVSPATGCQNQDNSALPGVSLMKDPILQFSEDERLIIEDIHNKFEVPWLQNFIMHSRSVETYLVDPQTRKIMQLLFNNQGGRRELDGVHILRTGAGGEDLAGAG